MPDTFYIVADIGGTNARFAAFQGAQQIKLVVYDTKGGMDLLSMAEAFSADLPSKPAVAVAALAGPVQGNSGRLTNANQTLHGNDLGNVTGASQAHIINDFAAAAWATHTVRNSDLSVLIGPSTPEQGTRLAIGPGTGLGVGTLIHAEGRSFAVPGEGGHIGIAPNGRFENEVFQALRKLWPDIFFGDAQIIEAEGILSGTGLPFLYEAICQVLDVTCDGLDGRAIFEAARNGSNSAAVETVKAFKTHLARVAGDLGLATGATGGVYMLGGIALKNPWIFDDIFVSAFREGGRFTQAREAMGLYLLNCEDFGIQGAYRYATVIAEN
ncbi:MAG: glucokinase [Donghicola eburneus]|nr:glucokinase [Donghicola eburneus]MCI5039083.1 glucokinase [Donghicola eburneus]